MAKVEPERQGNAVQLGGSFNPQIFTPAWFAAEGLIRDAEVESADIEIVHADVVAFELDWATVEVQRQNFVVGSTPKTTAPQQIRDLALGVIQVLTHTPVRTVSLRFAAHYALANQEQRDRLGWTLVSKQPWEGLVDSPGMRSLSVLGKRKPEDENEAVLIIVEPSVHVAPHGVFIAVNDRYDVADPEEPVVGAGPAAACLSASWDEALQRASKIPIEILELV